MSNKHAERMARVRQLQALEQQLAILRPQVEQDLREVIDDLQQLGISHKRMGQEIGRSKTVIHHLSAGQRRNIRAVSEWAAKLLAFTETNPKKPKGKPRGNVGKLLRQANKMRGDK